MVKGVVGVAVKVSLEWVPFFMEILRGTGEGALIFLVLCLGINTFDEG